jgi:hypothetical protein
MPAQKPAVLRRPRPDNNLVDAAEYDMMEIVWGAFPVLGPEVLADRSSRFTDMFKRLRDELKEANEAVKSAMDAQVPTAAAQEGEASTVWARSSAQTLKEVMERALTTAVLDGHAQILSV